MGLIYMRTSPSGGRYVGKTTFSEEQRWIGHCREARCQIGHGYDIILNRAIRKYGEDSFSVEILEDNIPDEELNNREIYWIENKKTYYLDNCHGYNMTRGGEGSNKVKHSEIMKLWNAGFSSGQIAEKLNIHYVTVGEHLKSENILSEEITLRGHRVGQEKRAKINTLNKEEQTKIFLELWNKNFTISQIIEETKRSHEFVSNCLKEAGISEKEIYDRAIKSSAITLTNNCKNSEDTKNIQQLWDEGLSVKEIKERTGFKDNKITRALNYYGVTKEERVKRGAQQANKTRNKPIIQCSKDGQEIKIWESAAQAGRELKIDASSIRKAVKGTTQFCGGYKWKSVTN